MTKPIVVIVCPKEFRFTDTAATVETPFLTDVADLRTVWLDFNAPIPEEVLAARAIILWHGPKLESPILARMKHCRAIIRNGVGFDTVDIAAAAQAGIAVCNVPDYGTEEVADHAIALTLALYRQLFPLDAEAGTHKAIGVERVSSLDELLRRADTLSVHCPLTAETRGIIGAQEIALMKPGSYVVNTARGDIVQKAPVFAALRSGHLAGAGLDVVESEPLRTAEEAATPNLIVTCHAAFCSPEGMIEMRSTSAKIARAAVLGEAVWNRVN